MKALILLAAMAAFAVASDVKELGDSDFADKMEGYGFALVKFYAPWCGHCKKMAPEFDRASGILIDNDPPINLVKVDCTSDGKATCEKYGVKGYPTLKTFKNGELAFDYEGPREADGIVKYLRNKAGPSSKELKTKEDAAKFLSSKEASIVGFFEQEGELQKAFTKTADALAEDFRFAHTYDQDIAKEYGLKHEIALMRPDIHKNKFEDDKLVYEGDAKISELKKWIQDNVHGLAGHRTTGNQDQFKKPLVVAYYEVDYVKNVKGTNYWRNRVMKVGKAIRDEGQKVYFAVSDKAEYSYELAEYGLAVDSDSPVVSATDAKGRKYAMKGEFSMPNFEKFVRDFLDDKLEPYLKSEPVPADNDDPAKVKVLVGKNFDEIVNDETKDVLIEFYAPWCGHCKTLAPKYDELAEKLKDEEDIVIAKMDATANDVPQPYAVSGFPTLYFSPKGSKNDPKKYQGGREVDDFIKYLAKESTDKMKGYDRKGKKVKAEL